MKYLLDTNIIISIALDDDEAVIRRISRCEEGDLVMSSISLAEVTHGSLRGKLPTLSQLEIMLDEIRVLPFDELAARTYATLPIRRHSYDRLIAAHALSRGLTIVTRNIVDFEDVPGLNVEDWHA